MGVFLRNNTYYYKKTIQGKTYYRSLHIKKSQEGLLSSRLKQMEDQITAEHFGLPYENHEKIGLLDYIEKYLKAKSYKKRWKRDKQTLLIIAECLGDPPLFLIGKKHIQKLEDGLFKRNIKPSTVNRYFEVFNHMMNLAIEDDYIQKNPVRFYVPYVEDGSRKALSEEEIKKILEASRFIRDHPRSQFQSIFYDVVVFALNTGMRLSEIVNLKREYIQNDAVFYPISKTKYRRRAYGQRKKFKIVCLNSTASDIIKKYQPKDEYVFPVHWRNPNIVLKTVKRVREISGVKHFTFHQIRHTVSTVLSSQVSLSTAKTMLGHADIKTTLSYTHPEMKEQRQGVAKLGAYFRQLQNK